MLLERTFSAKELMKYQLDYSIKSSNDKKEDSLALLVIKRASSTKAFQKKNAIQNWKVSIYCFQILDNFKNNIILKKMGKAVLILLKEKKCSPDKLFNQRSDSPLPFNFEECYSKPKTKFNAQVETGKPGKIILFLMD